ncbi:hypothetical protein E1H99_05835 [Enterococcus hirae]|nr:hypothetical protein E1H99_05835 [Enterococcus hirae]
MKNLEQKRLTPKKKEGIHENCFLNFCDFQLIIEGVASNPTDCYTYLERETKVNHTFVTRALFYFPLLLFILFL